MTGLQLSVVSALFMLYTWSVVKVLGKIHTIYVPAREMKQQIAVCILTLAFSTIVHVLRYGGFFS